MRVFCGVYNDPASHELLEQLAANGEELHAETQRNAPPEALAALMLAGMYDPIDVVYWTVPVGTKDRGFKITPEWLAAPETEA